VKKIKNKINKIKEKEEKRKNKGAVLFVSVLVLVVCCDFLCVQTCASSTV
jgi:hypothetical protein